MLQALQVTSQTPFHLSLWAAIAVGSVLLASRWIQWVLKPQDDQKQPQKLGHAIPFFGQAFMLAKDKKTFFIEAFNKCKRQPFSILVAGRRHYIFSDLADISAIHKNDRDLSIRGFKRFVYTHIFGFSKSEADLMWEVNKEAHQTDLRWLLGRDEQAEMSMKYFSKIEEHMKELEQSIDMSDAKAVEVDGLLTVVKLEGKSTVETFYGETTSRRNPYIVEDMMYFVTKGLKVVMFGVPRFLAKGVYGARDRITASFVELAHDLEAREDASGYVRERFGYINSRGVPTRAVGCDMFRNLFASLFNSLPTTYLAALRVLESRELVEALRQELQEAGYEGLDPERRVEILPGKCPLLRSVWFETLRVHNSILTVRAVDQDTQIATRPQWILRQGGMISIPSSLVHYDERLHPDANRFHERRFMDKSLGGEGENAGRTLKAFGGGSTYCPGRIFGEKQLMGFIAALIMRFDVDIVEKDFQIPPVADFDDLWARPRSHWRLKRRAAVVRG